MSSEQSHCDFCVWAMENQDAIRDEGADYHGTLVTADTVVHSYRWTISFLVLTISGDTSHQLSEDANRSGDVATLFTALFGWWGFPWGPFHTMRSLATNISGGTRSTVASLLAQQQWGVKVLDDQMDKSQQNSVCKITAVAAEEICRRRAAAHFEESIAALLIPAETVQRTCTVEFDFPVSDGNQWIFQAHGLTFLVRKRDTEYFEEKFVHFKHDRFVVVEEFEVA